tara:strand:+ start:66 stop:1007 length:942 start_codon:yes stop_codon:yes gene_type:complete
MKNKKEKFLLYSFYRFVSLENIKDIKNELESFFEKKMVRGTILVAEEGINGSLSGEEKELIASIKFIKKIIKIRKINLKINSNNYLPFNRLKIRLKKEIVTLGKGEINVNKSRGILVSPKNWDDIISNKDFKIIDTRNNFEIKIGSFKNAINPETNSFREFPEKFNMLNINKKTKIAMFCTGGIRCEKASSYLKENGYRNVFQLDGGIINYLIYNKNKNLNNKSSWNGQCFVFDDRVAIDKYLASGRYVQCYGCRGALTKKDTESEYYKKGVHCPHCFNLRTAKQKIRSETRQKQIDLNKKNNVNDNFQKVFK